MSSIKDLERLIKLCRKQGVQSIRFDGVELHLTELPQSIQRVNHKKFPDLAPQGMAPGGITVDTKILTDELTEEQLLMWSVDGNQEQVG